MTRAGGVPIAIVDPTSLLGRDVKAVLSERGFPFSKVHLFHSAGSEGTLAADDDEVAFVAPLTPDALDTSRVAFFCGRAEGTSRFLATRTRDGCLAIDLSGVRTGGPFATPDGALRPDVPLLLTYDPTAFVVAETLRLVDALAPIAAVTLAVDRPVSELGKAALDELFQQAIALAAFRPLPKEVLGAQAAFNIHVPTDSAAYERRVATDVRSLLGRDLPVSVLSARAGVFHGQLIRMELRFDGPAPVRDSVRGALFAPGTELEDVDPETLSGPVESAARDETLVLRVESSDATVRITLASDHLRRGAARLGVRLAEEWLRASGLDPRSPS